tara:strand:+ start:1829 stop:2050 length:222 start_codon:yes stop_codon:yes gene_type:complete
MARYKISKENINEFFGLFGKKKKPEQLKNIIKNDPTLQKLDKEIGDLNAKYSASLKSNKTFMTLAKKYGVEIK